MVIYDRSGNPLQEVFGTVSTFGEAINEAGQSLVSLPRLTQSISRHLIKPRNLLSFQDENYGLWAGVIWTPRGWERSRVNLTVYSGEFLFNFRRAPMDEFNGASGVIASKLLNFANLREPLGVLQGEVFTGGVSHQFTTKYDNMYKALTQFAERVGEEMILTPKIDEVSRKLSWTFNWYEKAGQERDFLLEYGNDFTIPDGEVLVEQGEIANDILVFGGGATPSATPISDPTTDEDSMSEYGLIEATFSNNSVVGATLNLQAEAMLAEMKEMRKTFNIRVVNSLEKKTFEKTKLGDTIQLSLEGFGFDSDSSFGTDNLSVRIKARDFDPNSGILTLVVDTVL